MLIAFIAIWRKTLRFIQTMMNSKKTHHATNSDSNCRLPDWLHIDCRYLLWHSDLGTGSSCCSRYLPAKSLVCATDLDHVWHSGCSVFHPALSPFCPHWFNQTHRYVNRNQWRYFCHGDGCMLHSSCNRCAPSIGAQCCCNFPHTLSAAIHAAGIDHEHCRQRS